MSKFIERLLTDGEFRLKFAIKEDGGAGEMFRLRLHSNYLMRVMPS